MNITTDSFSDGGRYIDPSLASAHAEKLLMEGADVIDFGAVSSSPGGEDVAPDEEIRRIESVLERMDIGMDAVSIDSCSPNTQAHFIRRGVGWINDIRGFPDPRIAEMLAGAKCRIIAMHSVQSQGRADFTDTPPGQIMEKILDYFSRKLEALDKAGIARNRIVIDPGMGYFLGTNPECSFRVIRELEKLARLGADIMVSVSRKSFIRKASMTSAENSGAATLCAEIICCLKGAAYIRTHEAKPLRDARRIIEHLAAGRPDGEAEKDVSNGRVHNGGKHPANLAPPLPSTGQ